MAAALAATLLLVLALHGERPEPGLDRFKPAGLLTAFAPEDAREIEVRRGRQAWRFRRDAGTWRMIDGSSPVSPESSGRIDAALRLLRDSGPMRVLANDEIGDQSASDYALGPGALAVTVRGPGNATFDVRFGSRNPLGQARYTRVGGVEGMPLLPAYVGDAWEQVVGEQRP